ncbi:MAG: hypothetical protein HKO55_01945 [Gammaproteobacteria bacterium]|nr:hypothetical protein [Gammaproteobacteria bacterium]
MHVYACFDLDRFLDSAWNNCQSQAQQKGVRANVHPVLFLTEAKDADYFAQLKANVSASTEWSFGETNEKVSLSACHADGRNLIIINGRQVVTSENLEVLTLATDKIVPDGQPADRVVQRAIENESIPVIPWGFGKWWGRRGKVLSDLLGTYAPDELFLGDNSGRPWLLAKPGHFSVAAEEGRRILPGSDPLPFKSEYWRPGSAGFSLSGDFDANNPAAWLRQQLKDPDTHIDTYMRGERLLPFVRNQVAMQIRKRK